MDLVTYDIDRRCGNPHLYERFEKLDAKIQLLRLVLHLPPDRLAAFVAQHSQIVDALEAADVDGAKKIMSAHILGQLDYYQTITG